jgi:hypothetical protein
MSNVQNRQPFKRVGSASPAMVDLNLQAIERFLTGVFVPKTLVAALSPYAVQSTDWLLLCDCTAGAITLTFPAAARVDGLFVTVVKTDASANAVTLSGTFAGVANPTIASQYHAKIIEAGNGVYYYPVTDIIGNAATATTATTADKVGHSLTAGTHLSGGPFDGSADVTLETDATSADTASTIASRDANGISGFKGIQFPASQSASSDANCLDDYEEGSWSPVVSGSGTPGTATYSVQLGNYTKIGNLVCFHLYIELASFSGATGNFVISLPVTTKSITNMKYTGEVGQIGGITHAAGYTEFSAIAASGASVIQLLENGSGVAGTNVVVGAVSGTAFFSMAGSFFTA